MAAASPALWAEPADTAPGAFDSPSDFYANDVFTSVRKLSSLQVRLDCGEEDPLLLQGDTRALGSHDVAARGRIPSRSRSHDGGTGNSVAPSQMRFLGRACGLRGVFVPRARELGQGTRGSNSRLTAQWSPPSEPSKRTPGGPLTNNEDVPVSTTEPTE